MMEGISDTATRAACLHIVATRVDFPPDIALLRTTALAISAGELHPETGAEAWTRVSRLIQGKTVELSARERAALDATGTMYDLKRSTNQAADRSRFIQAYDGIMAREKAERETPAEVARVNSAAQLRGDETKQLKHTGGISGE